ncbi:Uma2 family endonuclease [Halomicronema sp. CCY15110]|uniref:Uma2 family endonuclease n=1 Tax=Halomicronema sp. CCY15110 TaxID=2767773 RepID=UPI0019517674|nr:Uma2 family endonuclease [Halomicronema sp. CCY15110]
MVSTTEPQVHLWTRDEYYRLADLNFFQGRRVELIEGQVIDMAAMKSPHAIAIDLIDAALKSVFREGYYIRQQKPFVISDLSEPEPDIAVVPGSIRDYADAHPAEAVLIVEVADTSLRYDRKVKGSLYAKAGIAEYWILNLNNRQLEVYLDPEVGDAAESGFSYSIKQEYSSAQVVSSVAGMEVAIAVADLLP